MGVLDDKVAIVTGSARGIGKATAELLSEHGAKVVVNDLDGDVAKETADGIAGETAVYAGDLTAEGAPEALVQTAIDAWGKIDIVVNNAGYTLDAPNRVQGRVQRRRDPRREGPARHPRPDARHGRRGHPPRPPRHARGGRGRRLLPVLPVEQLRPRAGAEHH